MSLCVTKYSCNNIIELYIYISLFRKGTKLLFDLNLIDRELVTLYVEM